MSKAIEVEISHGGYSDQRGPRSGFVSVESKAGMEISRELDKKLQLCGVSGRR